MQSRDKYRIAMLAAYAMALHGMERLIPTPLPWLRLGLANIIILTALVLYGFRTAMAVTVVKCFATSVLIGTFLGPAFILSLSAGIVSASMMALVHKTIPSLFGPAGLSLIGALSHNLTQLFVAYFLFIHNMETILIIAPVILLAGTLTGALNGVVSLSLILKLREYDGD